MYSISIKEALLLLRIECDEINIAFKLKGENVGLSLDPTVCTCKLIVLKF